MYFTQVPREIPQVTIGKEKKRLLGLTTLSETLAVKKKIIVPINLCRKMTRRRSCFQNPPFRV